MFFTASHLGIVARVDHIELPQRSLSARREGFRARRLVVHPYLILAFFFKRA